MAKKLDPADLVSFKELLMANSIMADALVQLLIEKELITQEDFFTKLNTGPGKVISKIISGGQTGADRAALDFAIKIEIPHGGWIPKGRLAEDGPLPSTYKLKEMRTKSYSKRTEQNVIDSDATLILSHGKLTGGSKLTQEFADKHKKPCLHIDLKETPEFEAAEQVLKWTLKNRIAILNVAGSRASKDPDIYKATIDLLEAFYHLAVHEEKVVAIRETGTPKTVDEAVNILIEYMSLKNKSGLAKLSEDNLRNLRLSLGIYIRDVFRLDTGNRDLLESCREISKDKYLHHSQAPVVIINELWKSLRKTHKLRVVK